MSCVPKSLYGTASSTISVMRVIGQAFSMAIVSFVSIMFLKGVKLSHENYLLILKSMKTSFLVLHFSLFWELLRHTKEEIFTLK